MTELLRENSNLIAVLTGWIAGCFIVYRQRDVLKLRGALPCALTAALFSALSVLSAMLFAGIEGLLGGQGFSLGAVSLYGCFFICPLMLRILAKAGRRAYADVMDVYALYAVPSLFLMRCNCLISGCCSGRQIPGTLMHWPTREAEMVFYAIVFALLLKREKGRVRGTQFPYLTALYGTFRFVCEWFRVSGSGTYLHLAHAWSLVAAFAGYSLYTELNRQKKHTVQRG